MPYVSCGTPPRCSADLPVVKDFHQASAPRERACTVGVLRISTFITCEVEGRTHTGSPVHEIRRSLIGAEEQDLRLPIQIDELLLDTGALAWNEEIDNRLSNNVS